MRGNNNIEKINALSGIPYYPLPYIPAYILSGTTLNCTPPPSIVRLTLVTSPRNFEHPDYGMVK